MKWIIFILGVILVICPECYYRTNNDRLNSKFDFHLTDKNSTLETRALYYNLRKIASKFVLFGQQDATACGIGWKNEDLRSDINDVCGSFPSVYGWEISRVGSKYNIDKISFDRIKFWISSAYDRGSVNILSWHPEITFIHNNKSGIENTVIQLLPGGKNHQEFMKQLDLVADFILELKSKKGTFIPVMFKPFKDQNDSINCWGINLCTPEQFKKLWQFTVEYLRDIRNVHNVLYVFSTNHILSDSNYYLRYPGNEFVDILGLDDYKDFQKFELVPKAIYQLRVLANLAKKNNKIAALTETGQICLTEPDWWTKSLLYPIKNDSVAKNIAFIMIWRNTDINNFFAPYPGHSSVKDFIKFENDPFTLFEDDLPPMYKTPE